MTKLHDDITAVITDQMSQGAIGGAVVLVQRDGQIVDLQALGHAEFDPNFALKTDSIFAIFSMTKPVAAACALILVSEGKIGLDDHVSSYIPEFAAQRQVRTLLPGESYPPFPPMPGAEPAAEPKYSYAPADREITVRHLLNFTSGLQTIGIPNDGPIQQPEDTLASFVARLDRIPLEFQPGTQWHYSNATGYDVLGRIVEVASGQSLQDFVRDRIFAPLGMTNSQFGAKPSERARIVPLGFLSDSPVVREDYPSGSAGLFTTIEDYAKFAQMLLNDGMYEGRRVMPVEAVAAMRTPQIGDIPFAGIRASEYALPKHETRSAFTYGFGVGILDRPSPDEALPRGSYGWDGVGTRRFWVIPSLNTVLIMLMSGLGASADPTHKAIEKLVVNWAKGS